MWTLSVHPEIGEKIIACHGKMVGVHNWDEEEWISEYVAELGEPNYDSDKPGDALVLDPVTQYTVVHTGFIM